MNKYEPTYRVKRSPRVALQLLAATVFGLGVLSPVLATPEKAARFYEDALRRFDQNDTSGAVVQLKNALQEDKGMLAAHLLLGKALLKDGNLKGAEAAFEEALRQGVNRAEIVLPLGQIYLTLGRPEVVIERFTAAGLPPALQVEVLTLRGNAYLEMGNTRLASQSFGEARAIDPKAAGPVIAEASIFLASGQLDRAAENAAKAIELAPNDANAWSVSGSVKHAALDLAGALVAYDRALSLEPRHAEARVARAGLLVDLGRTADAQADLDFLVKSAPGEPRAAYLRALLAAQKRDSRATAAALAEVIKIVDALPARWLARREHLLMAGALAHHALGNREKASEYLNIIIANNSRHLAAKKLLAAISVETRDYARARPLLEELHKAAPDDVQVMFLLGSVHMAERRYQSASELLEKAAASTGSVEMTRALAFSQLELGQDELGQANLEKAVAADPGDFKAAASLSTIYLRSGQAQKAIRTAEALVRRHPDNLAALNFLGSVKAAAGDKVGARATYTALLAKDATFRPAALNLVKLDVSENRFDDARRRLDAMLAKHHDDSDALLQYGLLEQRAGRAPEAIRHLKKASEVQRRDPRAGLALLDVYLGQKQNEQALVWAKDLAARYPDGLAIRLAMGRALLANGDESGARNAFAGATRLADYDPRMQVEIARWQLAAGNPDGALYSAGKALQGRPDDLAAMTLVVEIETRRGEPARADAALKALNARYPKRLETALATGYVAMARGQYPAAMAAYRTALEREESTANALNLVRAQLAAGEAGKAASFLQGWVKTRPLDLLALKALAEAQFRAGQLAAARQTYARVIAEDTDDAVVLNNYANLLQQLKDPVAAKHAERALQLDPENPSYLDTLGWILVQQGKGEAGLRYLREARLRSPGSGEIRYHLAYALARGGRKAEARDELSAALTGPGRVTGSEAVNQLKKELGL
ncbi:XrtA/PEP-CTERM system TPR-repeat protein PrsT [Accumulibacter sp.]|uniref:XrtA/PEP-CTERM system TPR-repeat protein PrsT n=1 Tax=Accumulibacter sp. TaxID=2053492 RepID=UPI0028C3D9B1|nr:XrtA/PEP-CTERM system TPR-repeat protein PrsT [Accumulibacter sp.]